MIVVRVPEVFAQEAAPAVICTPAIAAPAAEDSRPVAATAAPMPPEVIFSELLPNPAGDDHLGEFIELQSRAGSDIMLVGWKILDDKGRDFALDSLVVPANGLVSLPYAQTKMPLGNTGQSLRLMRPDGAVADTVSYAEPIKEDWSWARDDSASWSWTTSATPGKPNVLTLPTAAAATTISTNNGGSDQSVKTETPAATAETPPAIPDQPQPTSTPDSTVHLVLSEFFPAPAGAGEEWIEIVNPDNREVPLAGWALDDDEKGSKPFVFTAQVLGPNAVAVFTKSGTALALNNDGDAVRIISPEGKVTDMVRYERAREGASFARFGDSWQWTDVPTPGQKENVSSANTPPSPTEPGVAEKETAVPDETVAATLEELPQIDPGTKVTVEGTITVAPGPMGKTVLAIQGDDGIGAATVRLHGKSALKIAAGDTVRLTGTLARRGSEQQIAVSAKSMVKIRSRAALVAASRDLGELDDSDASQFIEVMGTVIHTGKHAIEISDEAARTELRVTMNGSHAALPEVGSLVRIKGVLRFTKDKPELLVVSPEHLAVESRPTLAVTPQEPLVLAATERRPSYLAPGLSAAAILLAAGSAFFWRRRRLRAIYAPAAWPTLNEPGSERAPALSEPLASRIESERLPF